MFIPQNNPTTPISDGMKQQLKMINTQELNKRISMLNEEKKQKQSDREEFINGKITTPDYAKPSREARVNGEEFSQEQVVRKIDEWILAIENEIMKLEKQLNNL